MLSEPPGQLFMLLVLLILKIDAFRYANVRHQRDRESFGASTKGLSHIMSGRRAKEWEPPTLENRPDPGTEVIDEETARVLLARPERITRLDAGLLERLSGLASGARTALVEIAGRDSVAAAVAAARSGEFDVLVPTLVYTGTEFGDWEQVLGNAASLPGRLEGLPGVATAGEMVVLGSPAWWHASAGRFSGELSSRYGFNPTCIACHMYLHSARLPLASRIGARAIISGERLSHDRLVKLNQLEPALEAYRRVAASRGVTLLMPLERVESGLEVAELTAGWPDSGGQMSCVLESSYRGTDGEVRCDEGAIRAYLEEFLVPFTSRVLDAFAGGNSAPDYLAIAGDVITRRSSG